MNTKPEHGPGFNPLLQIFPAEVWKLSLSTIENPKDLWNVAQTDALFCELLKTDKEAWESMRLYQTLPQLARHLGKSDLLNLRHVCKKWRNAVDDFLEDGDRWRDRAEIVHERFRLGLTNTSEPQSFQNFSDVVTKMRAVPTAKIVGGFVRARIYEDAAMDDVHSFFREQGHKIFHLELQLASDSSGWTPLAVVRGVGQITGTTPNLRSFGVTVFDIYDWEVPHRPWKNRVAQHLKESPLPGLPQLKSLDLNYEVGDAFAEEGAKSALVSIYQAYRGKLKQLTLKGINFVPEVPCPSALTSMTLYFGDPTLLQTLESVRVSLEQLNLGLSYDVFGKFTGQVFKALESFGKTLTDLKLSFIRWNTEKLKDSCCFPEKVELPKLQRFTISQLDATNITSFDFLLNFPKLREIKINLKDYRVEEEEANVPKLRITWKQDGDWDILQFTDSSRFIFQEKLPWLEKVSIKMLLDPDEDMDSESEDDSD